MADDRVALVRQVKEANDIVDVVGGYVALRQVGPTFKGLCPFHDDHRPSFDVDPRRQRYRCWSCGKVGDVISFVQEHEHVDFREALELLARRAGISLEKTFNSQQNRDRAAMLEVNAWAAAQFQQCLLDSSPAEAARRYLGERRLTGETVRRFGLGFAPADWTWLVQRAAQENKSTELLEKVGLIGRRSGGGFFDKFRDRIIFPIRDARGQAVGFGGRILPSSPFSEQGPKYYNSSETPLFTKSEHLYGLDQTRQAATDAGYLAVVEGYTDVLMAHQLGVPQVVATLGTALNARHVRHLRRFVSRVVLVFDADAGGESGVDRALEIFASQDVDLRVATLPAGLDPCDLLVQQGAGPFREALENAADALEFKINQVLPPGGAKATVEERMRAVDAILKILALAPDDTGAAGRMKQDLMVGRLAQRLAFTEEVIRARLRELRPAARRPDVVGPPSAAAAPRVAKSLPHERELLQVLLAQPDLVPTAAAAVKPDEVTHPGLRRLIEEMYALHAVGRTVDLDIVRARIDDVPGLADTALRLQEIGQQNADRPAWLKSILVEFQKRRALPEKQELQNQLHAASDHTEAVELLRRLQQRPDFRF